MGEFKTVLDEIFDSLNGNIVFLVMKFVRGSHETDFNWKGGILEESEVGELKTVWNEIFGVLYGNIPFVVQKIFLPYSLQLILTCSVDFSSYKVDMDPVNLQAEATINLLLKVKPDLSHV